jgi:hypothetical protein
VNDLSRQAGDFETADLWDDPIDHLHHGPPPTLRSLQAGTRDGGRLRRLQCRSARIAGSVESNVPQSSSWHLRERLRSRAAPSQPNTRISV